MKIIALKKTNPYSINSASSNRFLSLAEGLSELGANVKVYITGGYRNLDEKTKFNRKGKVGLIHYEYLSTFMAANIWMVRVKIYFLEPLFSLFIQKKIIKKINAHPDAIIWITDDLDHQKAVLNVKKKPTHLFFMELNEFLDIHKINKGNFVQRYFADKSQNLFEEKTYFKLDAMALMTKTLLRHYENFPKPGPKLFHLPMTVDLERFNKAVDALPGFEKPYIAFVGSMNDIKEGVSILIKAFAEIAKEFTEYKLYLVGPWNYDTPMHQKLIKDLGLDEKVFWMGEYDRDKIPAIIKNADLLVLPRPDSKQAQGGFPTKLGEYLATGNPVCCTTVGEIPDYLVDEESAFLAMPDSLESFVKSMHNALSNSNCARNVGLKGKETANKFFNSKIQSVGLLKFLEKITNEITDRLS